MKKLFISLFIVAPLLLSAQWISTNVDGYVNSVSFLNQDTFLVNIGNSLLKTENDGQAFVKITNYPPGSSYNIWYKSIDTIFIDQVGVKGLLKSTNGGNTWTTQTFLMPNGDTAFKSKSVFFFGFFDQNNGIIIGDTLNGLRQVFLSEDGGITWSFYQNPSIDAIQFKMASQVRKSPYINETGNLRLIINAKMLFITNYGRKWSMDSLPTTKFINAVTFKDNDTGFAFIGENSTTNFFKTVDGGKSWVLNPRDTSYKLVSGRLIYAKGNGVFSPFILSATSNINGLTKISYDEGYSWHVFDTLNHQFVYFYNSVCGVSDFIRVGTASHLLRYDRSYTGFSNDPKPGSTRMVLYPNPANSEVLLNMKFKSIQIIDFQGKFVTSFKDINSIDISQIPNGLYWVKAIDDQGVFATQKLLIQH
jgi:photosystem II stability/assembly factor-like uncharacterized protein